MTHNRVRVDWNGKKEVPDHMERRDLIIKNSGQKGKNVKSVHLNKEVPTGLYDRER